MTLTTRRKTFLNGMIAGQSLQNLIANGFNIYTRETVKKMSTISKRCLVSIITHQGMRSTSIIMATSSLCFSAKDYKEVGYQYSD